MAFLRLLLRAAPVVVAGAAAGWWVSRRIGAPERPQPPAPPAPRPSTGRFDRGRRSGDVVAIVDDLLALR
jgi:hypothetical protein